MKKIIKIEGMSCEHCKKRVEDALSAISGVSSAKVNLKEKEAVVSLKEEVSDEILKNAVKEAGYEPKSVEVKKGLFS